MVPDPDLAAARERFEQQLRIVLVRVTATRQAVVKLGGDGETRLLTTALEGLASASRHAATALDSLANGGSGDAIAAYMCLREALDDSVLSSDFVYAFDAELTEAVEGASSPKRQRLWSETEKQIGELTAAAGSLAEAARDFSHSIDAKETGIMETDSATAAAIEELGITLATMIAGGSAAPSTRGAGGFATVTDQMAASLGASGFPQIGDTDNPEVMRQRLIDALKRNFSFKEQEGFRTYYRTARQTATRGSAGDTNLLRGGQRVNADLLEAEADALEDIIGRLPVAARFEFARGAEGSLAQARAAIHDELRGLVDSARDPMGINAPRAIFQFHRLVLAILQYLHEGEALPSARSFDLAPGSRVETILEWVSRFSEEEVRAPTSAVEDEELRAEIGNLFDLVGSIGGRLIRDPHRYRLGLYAARLEAQLTCALNSVDQLEAALEQSGTELDEQDVQFLSHGDGTGTPLSIGQFLRWTDSVARPFAKAGNRAATLRQKEAVLLALELASLAKAAQGFKHAARSMGVARLVVHQQLIELTGYLTAASENADALAGNARHEHFIHA
ncbi:MAG: hypothetical protein JWN66_1858 [Sphingomonas bacterium]|uniref:hypothetical protein n=1 Tax=Sphingomonas bacterium TaxID=1895847 RepID=UPI00263593F5|nr:hypothetical protein [Sphingomonas bacterium]MDB5704742.1 hypothetical protein [Sphingomonas bacterium]